MPAALPHLDASTDEDALIGLLRGEAGVDFCITISSMQNQWSVSIVEPGHVYSGSGSSFRAAMVEALGGVEVVQDAFPPLRDRLKIVAGTDAPMPAIPDQPRPPAALL